MTGFYDRNVGPESATGDRTSREQNRREAPGDSGVDPGRVEELVSDESLAWAKELVRRTQEYFSGSISPPPDEPAGAVLPSSNGSAKATRHRLNRRDRRDRRDRRKRRDASYGSSSAAGGTGGLGLDGKPGSGGPEQAGTSTKSNRPIGSAQYFNPSANRGVHMDGRSVAGGGQGGRAGDGKPAAGESEKARVASTSGRFAGSGQEANSGTNSSARLPGHSAAACGSGGRAVDGKPAAAAPEKARASSTSGRSVAAGDAANRTVKNDSGRQESSAADDVRQLKVSINHRSWLYLLGSICPAKGDEMLVLFDEVETRHRRLVDECDGSEAAELLAGEVITYWLERMKCSMEEQFESQSKGECVPASVAARARATESATKRLLSALKSYDERKSEKT